MLSPSFHWLGYEDRRGEGERGRGKEGERGWKKEKVERGKGFGV